MPPLIFSTHPSFMTTVFSNNCLFFPCTAFHLLMSHRSLFYFSCGSVGLSRFHIHSHRGIKKQQCPFGSFLMHLCFDTELLWFFFQPFNCSKFDFCRTLAPLFFFLLLSVEKRKHKAKEFFGEKESSVMAMFRSSYLWTR